MSNAMPTGPSNIPADERILKLEHVFLPPAKRAAFRENLVDYIGTVSRISGNTVRLATQMDPNGQGAGARGQLDGQFAEQERLYIWNMALIGVIQAFLNGQDPGEAFQKFVEDLGPFFSEENRASVVANFLAAWSQVKESAQSPE